MSFRKKWESIPVTSRILESEKDKGFINGKFWEYRIGNLPFFTK